MTIYRGLLVLVKIGDGEEIETFSTLGGLRASRIMLNNRGLDASNVENDGWRTLLTDAGNKSLVISGGGMFTNSDAEETLRACAFAGAVRNFQFVFANGSLVTGPFLVAEYERNGDHDAEETYKLTLASAGVLSFSA